MRSTMESLITGEPVTPSSSPDPVIVNQLADLDDMGLSSIWTEDTFTLLDRSAEYLPVSSGLAEMEPVDDTGAHYSSPVEDPIFSVHPLNESNVKDPKAQSGVCGLANLGNTCFMNAGLQCLFSIVSIAQYFICKYELDSKGTLTGAFAHLLKKVWSGNYSVIHPNSFQQTLRKCHPQFSNFRQHDCQEFLALLLDNLHEQLNTACAKSIHSDDSTDHCSRLDFSECTVQSKERVARSELEDPDTKAETSVRHFPIERETLVVTEPEARSVSMSPHSSDSQLSSDLKTMAKDLTLALPPSENNCSRLKASEYDQWQFLKPIQNQEYPRPNRTAALKRQQHASTKAQTLSTKMDPNVSPCSPCCNKLEKNELAIQLNSSPRLPFLEDFEKDTKILNTNMLAVESMNNNAIMFDSEKFAKHDNALRPQETLNNLAVLHVYEVNVKPNACKRIKDTNLLMDAASYSGMDTTQAITSNVCSGSDISFGQRDIGDAFKYTKRMRIEVEHQEPPKELTMDVDDMEAEPDLEEDTVSDCDVEEEEEEEEDVEEDDKDNILTTARECPLEVNLEEADGDNGVWQEWVSSEDTVWVPREEQLDADQAWNQYLSCNQSVIVDTFQGQFKSTVLCCNCSHVSVTYEPFMYLSVPLPGAMERQISVVVIAANNNQPVRYLVTLHKQDKVAKLKESLAKMAPISADSEIKVAEVLDNHIARILDDNVLLRYVNDTYRTVYAFEMTTNVLPASEQMVESEEVVESIGELKAEAVALTSKSNSASGGDTWKSCAICLEEMANNELMMHAMCGCVLCHSCIEVSCKHYGTEKLVCPVCGVVVIPGEEFVSLSEASQSKQKIRILSVPLLFRLDTDSPLDESGKVVNKNEPSVNNKSQKDSERKLFGHPNLLYMPSRISSQTLYEVVDKHVPFLADYELLLVDGQGYHCSRCLYTEHCVGCRVGRTDGDIRIQCGDNLAVRFTHLSPEFLEIANKAVDHKSMQGLRKQEPLTLYDCLQAFSESELLDEHNPWFCPVCHQNQCARKTLTVWRYPEVLIVYLKRFTFHELSSTKVDNKLIFPLENFDVSSYITGPSDPSQLVYDLQACLCHFGGVNSGHYTAYCKHNLTDEWYSYNDESVSKKSPQEDDYSSAYVLFYARTSSDLKQTFARDVTCGLFSRVMEAETEEKEVSSCHSSTSSKSIPVIDKLMLHWDNGERADKNSPALESKFDYFS